MIDVPCEKAFLDLIRLNETNYNSILYEMWKHYGLETPYVNNGKPAEVWSETCDHWVAACAAPDVRASPQERILAHYLLPGSGHLCSKSLCENSSQLRLLDLRSTRDVSNLKHLYVQDLARGTKAIVYYGASAHATAEIRQNGFHGVSQCGPMGRGIYLSGDVRHEIRSLKILARFHEAYEDGEILCCEVDLGRVMRLQREGPTGEILSQEDYDTVWKPPLVLNDLLCDLSFLQRYAPQQLTRLSNICVKDPNRIRVIR